MKRTVHHLIAALVVATAGFAGTADAAMLFTDPGGTNWRDHPGAVGLSFTVTGGNDLTVTALGFIDQDEDGLAQDHRVGLWDSSGSLVGEVTVASGIGATLIDGFRYVDLAGPVTLTLGQSYTIGAETFDGTGADLFRDDGTSATLGAEIGSPAALYRETYNRPEYEHPGTGFVAPNMVYAPVPEPASLTLAGLGGLALLVRRRR
ncbi:MAG: DUF4082 domain-containing protein [Phycisphaeraceae bacterium]